MKSSIIRLSRLEAATRYSHRRVVIIRAVDEADADEQIQHLRAVGEYDAGNGLICLTGMRAA